MVYQVGINKGIILRCTAYQISRNECQVRGINLPFYSQPLTNSNFHFLVIVLPATCYTCCCSASKQTIIGSWCAGRPVRSPLLMCVGQFANWRRFVPSCTLIASSVYTLSYVASVLQFIPWMVSDWSTCAICCIYPHYKRCQLHSRESSLLHMAHMWYLHIARLVHCRMLHVLKCHRGQIFLHRRIKSTKSPPVCIAASSASSTNLTFLLPQSRVFSRYVVTPILAPPPLWLQKNTGLRAHALRALSRLMTSA